ncbi:hydroxyectoine utilization dehydratase EutB [Sneathiella aquimaris]|uniref:hydroxyectoine utilization dehydratase EutB n=1 Tax=Sneathiella aquimaris TaxID=2599305 RepID=UPI001CA50538|nr:hydroxyectoine utilization dehydratase EutB [Sneathiella aquimaris]
MGLLTLDDIEKAQQTIHSAIQKTPIMPSAILSHITEGNVSLKLENLQTTGSFKLRGATNAVLSLSAEQRSAGIVGVSTGNHGRGLAYAAKNANVKCVICMSELVPENKVQAIKAQGADVRIVGRSQDEAQIEVDRLVNEKKMTTLPPFDHPDIIAGQGTLGLEIVEQLPEVQTVLVPVSGGGLISGTALALKTINPDIRIIGVSMEKGAAMFESQKAGKPVQVPETPTLADSLGGGIGLANEYTFQMVKDLVDELIVVNEAEIAQAIHHAYWEEKLVIEGAGSVGIAALLSGKVSSPGHCVLVISGSNIDMKLHKRIIDGENVNVALDQG